MYGAGFWKYVNKGLLLILGVFVLATIASIIFLCHTLFQLNSLIGNSSRSVGTALKLQTLLINLDDAETGMRGYVITGDATFLDPYTTGSKQAPLTLRSIQPDADYGLTAAQVRQLNNLTSQELTMMRQNVKDRAAGDEAAARARVSSGQGKALMDQIRGVVGSTSTRNLAELTPRQQQSHAKLRSALLVAAAVSVFVFGICIMLIWYFQYTILHERALESTKNEFLSLASHQLRTPATNVKQYVGMLLDGYIGDLTSKQQDALRIAYRNNETEIRIMNDLLDVTKLDLQRIQLRRQRVDVVSIVRQVMNEFQQLVDDRGQTMTLKAPPELMAVVDRSYFRGVIEKLVDNAVKYSHDRTRISVRIRADQQRAVFEVVVRDRGLGIEKREVPKLFMKFSRLTNEFSAHSEGSGIGLYWVKQIMALHGGSVRVVSQEGRGSKFIVRAPIGPIE